MFHSKVVRMFFSLGTAVLAFICFVVSFLKPQFKGQNLDCDGPVVELLSPFRYKCGDIPDSRSCPWPEANTAFRCSISLAIFAASLFVLYKDAFNITPSMSVSVFQLIL